MRVLIIENEIYLAQSIGSKLDEAGYACVISNSLKESLKDTSYDVVLLSTNISSEEVYQVIDIYKHSVVILMASYMSNDTVSKPLQAGAKDYILKPFMIEELIRKIKHFKDFELLREENDTYRKYLSFSFDNMHKDHSFEALEQPLFVHSSYQKHLDAYAFKYAAAHNKNLHFISLSSNKAHADIKKAPTNSILYITDFQNIKKSERESFFKLINSKEVIVSSTDPIEDLDYDILKFKSENNIFEEGEILTIEEYVKYIVANHQSKIPDTELSKRLGISRKSLWEKRKKYGMSKTK
ncbi:MAG: response regulator [Helicobacteraceae bacterium]|nr:response regulator [Helicobacteraceae bacterium]